jgi:sugar phosphate isomerase/epimerase
MDRRTFLSAAMPIAAANLSGRETPAPPLLITPAVVRPLPLGRQREQYRIAYTPNTRGGWEGNPFKGIEEVREAEFRYVEVFGSAFCRPDCSYFPNDAEGLMRRMSESGVNFVSITGGAAAGQTRFEDPQARDAVIENHFAMARFARRFGCVHHKTNLGKRRPEGTTAEDLQQMAVTVQSLDRRLREELGMVLGIHPHLGSQLQTAQEIEFLMQHTDVALVLDTGHITMAGMDPLELAQRLGHRVLEYHLKDTKPADRGGARTVPGADVDQMAHPYFFPLGAGGVDFPGLKAYLDRSQWRGVLTVELDASPWRSPLDSARLSADYLQNVLKMTL